MEPPLLDAASHVAKGNEKLQKGDVIRNTVLLFLILMACEYGAMIFQAMYSDFGARLPMPTKLFFDVRLYLPALPVALLVVCVVSPRSKMNIAGINMFILLYIFQILLLLAIVSCLFLPVFQLGAQAAGP